MNLIVAVDQNWAIGKDGRLLVNIPADRQLFMKETTGKTVVMGIRPEDVLAQLLAQQP